MVNYTNDYGGLGCARARVVVRKLMQPFQVSERNPMI